MRKILLFLFCLSSFIFAAININTATKEELVKLKGIGEKKAEAIIEYRTQQGAFKSIEEIQKVRGIGPKQFESIKNEITVDEKLQK
ncbi:DNA-binding protein [Helicobacter monodelphidis]|uniref:ComEA family DNA-binding protein n=1 Tax=Helicobacter sp. 15-1451 TaxID=2004995 RepID=UPI000DCE38A5|nr:ComEA family DNA-binding protein [Helicobacter sp. 15-1451]RAX57575.1 DNA-binding protein [Helicobacter sp. 15-1451]